MPASPTSTKSGAFPAATWANTQHREIGKLKRSERTLAARFVRGCDYGHYQSKFSSMQEDALAGALFRPPYRSPKQLLLRGKLVGVAGFEPATPSSRTPCFICCLLK